MVCVAQRSPVGVAAARSECPVRQFNVQLSVEKVFIAQKQKKKQTDSGRSMER